MKQSSTSSRLLLFRVIILLIGLGITTFVYLFVSWQQKEQALNEINIVSQQRSINLANHITARIGILDALAATLLQSEQTIAPLFDKQTDIYLRQYTDIHAIYWSPYTPKSKQTLLSKKASAMGIEDYSIYLPESAGTTELTPATDELFYLPTLLQKQRYQAMPKLGMDILHEPQWRDHITKALEQRHVTTTRPQTIVAEQNRSKIIWLFYPIFWSERDAQPLGVISMMIHFDDFIDNAISTLSTTPVPIEIYDIADHTKSPIYHWPENELFNAMAPGLDKSASLMPFFDKDLRVVNVATEHYLEKYQNELPLWLALFSLICTGMVYIAIKLTQNKTEELYDESNQRCWQLEQTNKTLNNKVIEKSTFEKAHKDLQERLNDYLNLSEDYFWEVDENLHYNFVSRRCLNVTGYPANSLIGSDLLDNLVNEDAQVFKGAVDKMLQKKMPVTIEVRCWAKDNMYRNERMHITPLFNHKGKIRGYRGISRDITDKGTVDGDEIVLQSSAFSGRTVNSPPKPEEINLSEGSSSAYMELISNFVEQHERTGDILQQAFFQDKYDIVKKLAKKLKKDAQAIGSDALESASAELLDALKVQSNATKIEEHVGEISQHLEPLINNMKNGVLHS